MVKTVLLFLTVMIMVQRSKTRNMLGGPLGHAPDTDVTEDRTIYRDQSVFLSNTNNKKLFVGFLSNGLKQAKYTVSQAVDDADTLIVRNCRPFTVTVNDTGILVMLVHHFLPDMADIYTTTEDKVQSDTTADATSIRAVRQAIGETAARQLL